MGTIEISLLCSMEPNDLSQDELTWECFSSNEHVCSQVSACKRISAIVHNIGVNHLLNSNMKGSGSALSLATLDSHSSSSKRKSPAEYLWLRRGLSAHRLP